MYVFMFIHILIQPISVLIKDVTNIKGQIRGTSVDVQMETAKGHDLNETIDKIRQQYEKATQKNQEETEAWYRSKVRDVLIHVHTLPSRNDGYSSCITQ